LFEFFAEGKPLVYKKAGLTGNEAGDSVYRIAAALVSGRTKNRFGGASFAPQKLPPNGNHDQ
jgi:hypothetical protein